MEIIDVRGKQCPAPLIITKRAIKGAAEGVVFKVLCDNETAKNNLLTYLKELDFVANCSGDVNFEIVFEVKSVIKVDNVNVGDYCNGNGYCVVLKGKLMGDGDEKLGVMLMRAFVNSLTDSDILPKNIIIYNEGVFLALEGNDTAESLKTLADKGVTVTVCGTCVEFYGVKERLAVGNISNMYKITEILSQSSNVIYP